MPVGTTIGAVIGTLSYSWILIPIGLVLGAVVVCAEPAVWVLNEQIEEISGGHIKKRFMLVSLSAGIAFSIALSMFRVLTGASLWQFIIPGYLLAMVLTFFTPKLFTAIAFDSGGVASGPMTSTFILSFTLGASLRCHCHGCYDPAYNNSDSGTCIQHEGEAVWKTVVQYSTD